MSTSSTPRTDKERFTLSNYRGWLVPAELAEKLESEQRATPTEETRKIGREDFDGHPEKQPNPNPEQRATTADPSPIAMLTPTLI